MYEYAWPVMNLFTAAAAACVNYKQIPYIYIYILNMVHTLSLYSYHMLLVWKTVIMVTLHWCY